MLITLRNILDIAESKNMAIAAFNATSLEGIMAVIEAAEEENTPVILQFANAAHGKYIPLEKIDSKVFGIAGTKSGRNIDKLKEANLTLIDSDIISSPAIKELPITLECKVLYKQKQVLENLPEDIVKKDYPQDVDGTFVGANRDPHTAYYAEIVAAYIIEE